MGLKEREPIFKEPWMREPISEVGYNQKAGTSVVKRP